MLTNTRDVDFVSVSDEIPDFTGVFKGGLCCVGEAVGMGVILVVRLRPDLALKSASDQYGNYQVGWV